MTTKTQTQFMKMIGEIVGDSLTTKDRSALLKRFKDSKETWVAFLNEHGSSTTARRTKRNVDPSAPKKPKNAYLFFCNTNHARVRSENPEAPPAEVMTMLGKQWQSLSESDRAPFVKMAEEDKTRYSTESQSYQPPSAEELASRASAPKPRRVNGYNLFCRENKEQFKNAEGGVGPAQQSAWKALSDAEKKVYSDRAKNAPVDVPAPSQASAPTPKVVASAPVSESVASESAPASKARGGKKKETPAPTPAPAPVQEEPVPAPAPAKGGKRAVARKN